MSTDEASRVHQRIIIADDHAVLRAGLRLLINGQTDMEIAGEAADSAQALALTRELRPDILLLDLTMPGQGGLSVLRQVRKECPDVRVLVLTMHDDDHYLRQALEAGAAGYVPKSAADTDLLAAIRAVARGNLYVHPSQTKALLERLIPQHHRVREQKAETASLSDRERDVVRMVALGHTNQWIADELHVSVKTVETYRARAMEKLGIRNRAALVRYALESGLLSSPTDTR